MVINKSHFHFSNACVVIGKIFYDLQFKVKYFLSSNYKELFCLCSACRVSAIFETGRYYTKLCFSLLGI